MNTKRLIEQENFYLNVDGYYRDSFKSYTMSFHAHPRVGILYAEEGAFTVVYRNDDGKICELTAEKGQFLFLEADVLHSMKVPDFARILNVEMGIHRLYRGALILPMDLIIQKNRKLLHFLKGKKAASLLNDFFNVKELIDRIHTEMDNQHSLLNEENFSMVQALICQLLITVGRCHDVQAEEFKGVIHVKKAVEFIHRNYQDKVSVPEIAHYCGINPAYLQRVFKQVQGETIIDFLTAFRLERAVKLMENTVLPLLDIATEVGFENRQSFYVAFKRVYGVGPMQYRKGRKSDSLFMLPGTEGRRDGNS